MRKASIITLVFLLGGCMSYRRIDNPYDPRVRDGGWIIIHSQDGNIYHLRGVRASSGVLFAHGMKCDASTNRWRRFEGAVPIQKIATVYVQEFDPALTSQIAVGFLLYAGGIAAAFLFVGAGHRRLISPLRNLGDP